MRPEMRVTQDSINPVAPRKVGGKVTKKKAKMFNIDVLEELNFWRYFFFQDRAHLMITFGDFAALSVAGNFLSQKISWPGVPADRAKSFKNAVVEEDLFGSAEFEQLGQDDEEEELTEELDED